MGYNVAPYAVRPSLWQGLKEKEDWLRHPARRAKEANRSRDLDIDTAIDQMIGAGQEYDREAHVYWYALELLAEQNGEWLGNHAWASMPRPTAYIDWVLEALTAAGSPEAAKVVSGLFWSHPPVDLPYPEDFPVIGYLPVADMPGAVAVLDAVDLSGADPELAPPVREIRQWLDRCQAGRTQKDLLTFLY